jgi:excisionase family DNA binding protein
MQTAYLTANEVAARFRCSLGTVYNWARDRSHPLVAIRVGGRWLFPADLVEQLEQAKLAAAAPRGCGRP